MRRSIKIRFVSRGTSMLFYSASASASASAAVAPDPQLRDRGHPPPRRQIGSPWRKLNPGRQALLVLAYLRKGERFADLAAGFGIGTATAWRYVTETVGLLAARPPTLRTALADASPAGHAYVVLGGTLVPIDRVAADRPFYSGKHRRHGMNLQVLATPDGEIVWVSGPLPGAVHDLAAARIWGILRTLAASGLVVLADKGYHGAGEHIRTPRSQPGASAGRPAFGRAGGHGGAARRAPAGRHTGPWAPHVRPGSRWSGLRLPGRGGTARPGGHRRRRGRPSAARTPA
jgi:hypothetical protein